MCEWRRGGWGTNDVSKDMRGNKVGKGAPSNKVGKDAPSNKVGKGAPSKVGKDTSSNKAGCMAGMIWCDSEVLPKSGREEILAI